MQEMKAAEQNGTFDYNPTYDPNVDDAAGGNQRIFRCGTVVPPTIGDKAATELLGDAQPPPLIKRKNSLDDFELEIDGINLDDNLDTSVSVCKCGFLFLFTIRLYIFRT